MFIHHCVVCSADYLQGTRSILQLHNTIEGPVGLVECQYGHQTIVNFRTGEAHDPSLAVAV